MKYCEFCLNKRKGKKGSTVYAMFQFVKQMIMESFLYNTPNASQLT